MESQARPTVVVMDEDPDARSVYRRVEDEFVVLNTGSEEEILQLLQARSVAALVVTESALSGRCLPFLARISRELPDVCSSRIVVLEHTVAGELARWVNEGRVFSCLRKPFDADHLRQVCRRAADRFALTTRHAQLVKELAVANERLERENALLRRRFQAEEGFHGLVGHSPELRAALLEVTRFRDAMVPVHVSGETGTGKERVARALHHGRRGLFVAINCASISEQLLQSTLFGHRRGAFTGADRDHAGVFEQAHGGTLLLDEVAELPLAIQGSLLRALQEKEIWPLGARAPVKVDVRVISATHKDLRREVEEGRFREDLFYRLLVVAVHLPALRERTGDIALLARHFLELQCEAKGKDVRGFTADAMLALEQYRWPGNVRELENEIERAVLMADPAGLIGIEHLSSRVLPPVGARWTEKAAAPAEAFEIPLSLGYDAAVEQLERAQVRWALAQSGGTVAQAARLLQIERTRLVKLRARIGE